MTPSEYIDYFVATNYGAYDRSALFLVHQGSIREDYSAATQYLNGLPEFPIDVATHKSSMALMVLQYRAGMLVESTQTAQALVESMNRYLRRSPGSYRFYNLAKHHLIAAVYTNDFDQAEQILSTGFAENHPYWQDDIAAVRIALSPWLHHPVVAEYIDRIEVDRRRARDKLGLE